MKHIIQVTIIASLVLSTLVACNPNDKNDPQNDPNTVGTEAWYRAQLTPIDSSRVTISDVNITGQWGQYAQAVALNGKIDPSQSKNWIVEDGNYYPDTLLFLNENYTCRIYYTHYVTPDIYGWDAGSLADWSLSGETLHFTANMGGMTQNQTIIILEKDRLILQGRKGERSVYNMFRRHQF